MQNFDWRRIGLAGILGLASFGFGYLILRFLRRKFSNSKKPAITPPTNVYETDQLVNQYMAFHYAKEEKYFKYDFGPKDHLEFPLRCAKLCAEHMTVRNRWYPVYERNVFVHTPVYCTEYNIKCGKWSWLKRSCLRYMITKYNSWLFY